MWPFKSKSNDSTSTHTTTMSGLLTCDGKHHMWSSWKDTTRPYVLSNVKTGEWTNATIQVQERRCVVCNYSEVREDSTN